MLEFLSHPMTLLVTGAVLTGFIVPAVTRQWQLRQKGLEVKVALVEDISEATMTLVIFSEYYHNVCVSYNKHKHASDSPWQSDERKKEQEQGEREVETHNKNLDDAFRNWEIASAVIESKLQAYFPSTMLPRHWMQFCKAARVLVSAAGIPVKKLDNQTINAFLQELPVQPGSKYPQGWKDCKQELLNNKAYLIERILVSRVWSNDSPGLRARWQNLRARLKWWVGKFRPARRQSTKQ